MSSIAPSMNRGIGLQKVNVICRISVISLVFLSSLVTYFAYVHSDYRVSWVGYRTSEYGHAHTWGENTWTIHYVIQIWTSFQSSAVILVVMRHPLYLTVLMWTFQVSCHEWVVLWKLWARYTHHYLSVPMLCFENILGECRNICSEIENFRNSFIFDIENVQSSTYTI